MRKKVSFRIAASDSIVASLEKETLYDEQLDLQVILGHMKNWLCGIHRKCVLTALRDCLPSIKNCVDNAKMEGNNIRHQKDRVDLQALRFWYREMLPNDQPARIEISWNVSDHGDISSSSLEGMIVKSHLPNLQKATTNDWHSLGESFFSLARDLGLLTFIRFAKARKNSKGVKDRIEQKLKAKTTVKKSGWIYTFTFSLPAYAGKYKIGFSKTPVKRVEDQWGPHWNSKPKPIFIDENETPIPHIRRAEDLIYAELEEFRRIMHCCRKCRGSHLEWVATSETHVKAVIQKWATWMRTKPYEEHKGSWKLKEAISNDDISRLCEPLPDPEQEQRTIAQESTVVQVQNEEIDMMEALKMRKAVKEGVVKTEIAEICEKELDEPTPDENDDKQLCR